MTTKYENRGPARLLKIMAATAVGATMLLSAQQASALTFNATFGNDGSTGNFSAGDIACINSVLTLYSNTFTDNVTINLRFNNSASGLGGNNPFPTAITDSWQNVHNKLIADATTADDTAALAQLNALPISNTQTFEMSSANAKALGYSVAAGTDDTIALNAGICFNTHTAAGAAANPSKYDLFGVTCHELDEALGTVSGVSFGSNRWTADAYRYHLDTATGNLNGRSFTTSTSERPFFSIDGTTQLDEYNQRSNGNGGDYGDWIVHNPYQVQDYAGTPGKIADPNVELRLLDVVGYNRAVPEPATMAALGLGFAAVLRRRRKR